MGILTSNGIADFAKVELRWRRKSNSSYWVGGSPKQPEIGNTWETSIMHNMGCAPGRYIATNREKTTNIIFLNLDLV